MATFWERAAHSVGHMFSLYFDFLEFQLFPILVLGAEFWFCLPQVLFIAYVLLLHLRSISEKAVW